MEQLVDDARSKSDAGEEISRERYCLEAELIDERKKTKSLTGQLDSLSRTVAKLNESVVSLLLFCSLR